MRVKIPVALVVDVEMDLAVDGEAVPWEWQALALSGQRAEAIIAAGCEATPDAARVVWGELLETCGRLVESGYEARVWPVAMRCGEALVKVEV